MLMNINVAELDQLVQAASSISQVQGLPFKVSYWIARVNDKLKSETKVLGETRQQIFAQHGTLNDEGTSYNFASDQVAAVNKLLADLGETTVDIDLPQIRLADISQAQGLTGATLAPVLCLINEQEGV